MTSQKRPKLDDDQVLNALGWLQRSEVTAGDAYTSFMNAWIGFNATCYGLYHHECTRLSARPTRKLRTVEDLKTYCRDENNTLKLRQNEGEREKYQIRAVVDDVRLFEVEESFVESMIFDLFVDDYKQRHIDRLQVDQEYQVAVRELRDVLTRDGACFVWVVSKATGADTRTPSNSRLWDDPKNLTQLKGVLTQVRNNLFHGMKMLQRFHDVQVAVSSAVVVRLILADQIAGSRSE